MCSEQQKVHMMHNIVITEIAAIFLSLLTEKAKHIGTVRGTLFVNMRTEVF